MSLIEKLPHISGVSDFHKALTEHRLISAGSRFIHLEIDVTNKCNLRCRMCHFSFDRHFNLNAVHLAPGSFAELAIDVFPYCDSLMLSIGSEPLMSPHFIDILQIASKFSVPNFGFYTNGMFLSDEIIDAVIMSGVTVVSISIDGAKRKTFESIRRGADFNLLLKNLRKLRVRKEATGSLTPKIRFGVVMMKKNIREIEDIVTLAWRNGVEELNFFHLVAYSGLGMEKQSLIHHKALSNKCLRNAVELAGRLGIKVVHAPAPFSLDSTSISQEADAKTELAVDYPYCHFPFFHVSVNSRLDVLTCPFSHNKSAVGTISAKEPFERIWFGPLFTALRLRILKNDPPAMCRSCSFLASRFPDQGDFFSPRDITNSSGPSNEGGKAACSTVG